MDFSKQYQNYLAPVEREIAAAFPVPDLPQKHVFSAMQYGICGGGKRIRPVLTMAVCDMLGGNLNDAAKAACAIEAVHNYSLIHDDLPCMDNDDLRRGRPTCHKVYGEDIALLAGDGLLNCAFEILANASWESLTAAEVLALVRTISSASGAFGMIGGQVIDLESENRTDVTLAELQNLHRHKTGDLICAAAELGCICGKLTDGQSDEKKKIITYAEKLGLAFQIKDDILDVVGDEKVLGKPIGSDAAQHKNTFVTLLGLAEAEKALTTLTDEAKSALDGFKNTAFLCVFADYLLNRNY